MAHVYLTPEAEEDLDELDGSARKLVLKALVKLEDHPDQRGEPLGSQVDGDLTTFRKLVVGDRQFRIIFRIERDGTICVIWVIGERVDRKVYDIALARVALYRGPTMAAQLERALDELFAPST